MVTDQRCVTPVSALNSSARDPLDEEALVKADRVFSVGVGRRDYSSPASRGRGSHCDRSRSSHANKDANDYVRQHGRAHA